MFGDKTAYLEKFKTSVRSRAYGAQVLGSDFYVREHSKPLFNIQNIFTVQNLYNYHTLLDTFKIIKNHTPISMYSCFTISHRKDSLLITPSHSHNFMYNASSLWNMYRTCAADAVHAQNFSAGIGYTKNRIKALLLHRQRIGDQEEWADTNFQLR